MSKPKHTPGPWSAEPGQSLADGSNAFDVMAPDPSEHASPGDLMVVASYLTPANARLIAAAPDLLAALVRVTNLAVNCVPGCTLEDEAIREASAAIAKATHQSG